jgi:anti-sigma factor RsiW
MSPFDSSFEVRSERAGPSRADGPPLTCRDVIGLLLDYLEDALDAELATALERHREDCAACRVYLRTYDRSRRLVGGVARDEMPAEVKDRLRALLLRRLPSTRS